MLNYRSRKISHRFYDEIVKVMLLLWPQKKPEPDTQCRV
ncbi:hypothetical protein JCM19240_6498 [Vibrio maritimus]|uniref:Uncharacterized protein n=1 Tax=Vibrio maritimus TaxID=990268 RepID=A0A090SZI5_9VIBR|nr:hypothetical protein JCM19240_6498 [Vibrio maritimus]